MIRLLLDESIPRKLISFFPANFDVRKVPMMGWAGTKNGRLLRLAHEHEFKALVTADRGIEYQQNFLEIPIFIIVLLAHRTHIRELAPLIPSVLELLQGDSVAGVYRISR